MEKPRAEVNLIQCTDIDEHCYVDRRCYRPEEPQR